MKIPSISVTLDTFCEINTRVTKAIQCIVDKKNNLEANEVEAIELLLKVSSLCNSCTSGMVAKEKIINEMFKSDERG